MEKPIISVQGIRKVYPLGREKVVALRKIDLDIQKGEICCILGTSGSGKSTLLNQLAGLEKPTRGHVEICGVNISRLSERQLAVFRQKHIGFIFQSYNLLPAYTACENVAMPLAFRGFSVRQRNKAAISLLKKVGLGSRLYHKPTEMSGGQQQRVGIARAFVSRPQVVFADEPTGNLDSKTTIEVMELMVRLCRKYQQTLVIVTHEANLAAYADRIVTLVDGSIISNVENRSIIDREGNKIGEVPPSEEELFAAHLQQPEEKALPASTDKIPQDSAPAEGKFALREDFLPGEEKGPTQSAPAPQEENKGE